MNSLVQVDELVKEYLLVDKIVEELIGYVIHGDVVYMLEYYRYLDVRFFSRLDSRFQRTVKKFELSLPYVKQPATDPTFETFFSKQWVENYTISLHNFLATTFQNMRNLLSFNIERIQRKAQQTEIESLKSSVDNLKATVDARENEIAKLKHEVAETRREMTDGITLIRRRAASMTTDAKANGAKAKVGSQEKKNEKTVPKGPFVIVSQEEFSEHASAITHAKFSTEGNLIASCDMDNIVRIWSYKGQSFNPLKVNNNTSNILSMEWEARSDRFLSCSPVEPMFVCAGSGSKASADDTRDGVLVAWSMKTMAAIVSFVITPQDTTFN
ncbi:hypothetical protein J3Q64DRAFT_1644901 [Phycomyces blakesleeanus]|uniref:ARMC9 CTLH-like domain-containing protein n=1 Tax=Phycomyces blakesleeanus TaxID=4837 RepID=A0ABR3AR27_PHYBL